jgi:hypothetical protein
MRKIFSTPHLRGYLYALPILLSTGYFGRKVWAAIHLDLCNPLSGVVRNCSTWQDVARGMAGMLIMVVLFFLLVIPLGTNVRLNLLRTGLFLLSAAGYAVYSMMALIHGGSVMNWQFGYALAIVFSASLITGIELLRWMRSRRKVAEAQV